MKVKVVIILLTIAFLGLYKIYLIATKYRMLILFGLVSILKLDFRKLQIVRHLDSRVPVERRKNRMSRILIMTQRTRITMEVAEITMRSMIFKTRKTFTLANRATVRDPVSEVLRKVQQTKQAVPSQINILLQSKLHTSLKII